MEYCNTYRYKRVLVIDDKQLDLFIARKLFALSFFAEEVITEQSGGSALAYLQSISSVNELPQLIFLDVRMPEMDGFEFLELFDKLPDNIKQTCHVVMFSSSVDKGDYNRAMQNKYVHCFIDKPLKKEKLNLITPPPFFRLTA